MRYQASHFIVCNAAPARVYDVISHSSEWPRLLEPCESVTVLAADADSEHIELSARVNGELMTWQSRRRFVPAVFGVEATVIQPMKLVKAMTTSWRVIEVNTEQSVLLLEHDYDLCDDITGQVPGVDTVAQAEAFIATAIDANSTTELRNIKAAVEHRDSAAPDGDMHLRHSIVCHAPADAVYALIRSTDSWPKIFDACLGVTRIQATGDGEVVRVAAAQDGRVVTWDTRRQYFDAIRRVDYQLLVPMPFVEAMSGQWRVIELDPQRCLLTVDRTWRMLPDVTGISDQITTVAEAAAFVRDFVDGNATAEMHAIRALLQEQTTDLTSVTSRFHLPYSPDAVFAVLADVASWPKVLPHCDTLELRYDDGSDQEFVMHVQTAQHTETFRSVRHCDETSLTITYFQPEPPRVMHRHRGSWQVRGTEGGCEVIAWHTALLDPAACAEQFATTDVRDQKRRIREMLERNSLATVEACGHWLAANTPTPPPAETTPITSAAGATRA